MNDAPEPARVAKILASPTVTVPEAGYVLGLGRDASYEAAKRGEIKTINFGKLKRVPTAWLRKLLDLDAATA